MARGTGNPIGRRSIGRNKKTVEKWIFLSLFALFFCFFSASVQAQSGGEYWLPPLSQEEEKDPPAVDRPEGKNLRARILDEILAVAPELDGDPELEHMVREIQERVEAELVRHVAQRVTHRVTKMAESPATADIDADKAYFTISGASGGINIADMRGQENQEIVDDKKKEEAYNDVDIGQYRLFRDIHQGLASGASPSWSHLETEMREALLTAAFESGKSIIETSQNPFLGSLELEYALARGGVRSYSVLGILPVYESEDLRHSVFSQLSWLSGRRSDVRRNTANIGLAYRYMTENEKHLLGGNLFLDHEWPLGHRRVSLGADYKNSLFSLHGSRYIGLSGWKDRDNLMQERAMSGWDLELGGRIPDFPSLEIFVRGYLWEQDKTAVLNPDGSNIWGRELRAEYTPVPSLTFEAAVRDETLSDNPEGRFALRYNYRFGHSFHEQMAPQQQDGLDSVADRRFERVRRENTIRTQERFNPDGSAQTPDSFAFSSVENAAFGTAIMSAIVQISGIVTGAAVSISGDGNPEYRICTQPDCTDAGPGDFTDAAGTVENGQYLQLRLTSSDQALTTRMATVNVGTGNASWSVTSQSYALEFANNGNYVETTYRHNNDAGSLAFWLFLNQNNTWSIGAHETSTNSNNRFYISSQFGIGLGGDFTNSGITLPLSQWHHMVLVFESGNAQLFANGTQIQSLSFTWGGQTQDMYLGAAQDRGGGLWNQLVGRLDDVRIYDRALTAGEMTMLRNGSDVQAGLTAHWRMNEGQGGVTADDAGNNNGILINSPAWVAVDAIPFR
ncbi:MAG: hypothetical protein EA357_05600 [Micavibrio sp.]|nr:MAG: hypothetical protein EA357_05600 [Micavibrio sp.]